MLAKPKCPVIALEEHYWDKEAAAAAASVERNQSITSRLLEESGEIRIREMDEAGVDIQVLSHGAPSAQKLAGSEAPEIAARVNDRLAAFIKRNPTRFGGFACLPTCNPQASADELERAVTKHGFKGAMIHGLTGGQFHDGKEFGRLYERAEKLDVPIYFHPSVPHPAVMDAYYKDTARISRW